MDRPLDCDWYQYRAGRADRVRRPRVDDDAAAARVAGLQEPRLLAGYPDPVADHRRHVRDILPDPGLSPAGARLLAVPDGPDLAAERPCRRDDDAAGRPSLRQGRGAPAGLRRVADRGGVFLDVLRALGGYAGVGLD